MPDNEYLESLRNKYVVISQLLFEQVVAALEESGQYPATLGVLQEEAVEVTEEDGLDDEYGTQRVFVEVKEEEVEE